MKVFLLFGRGPLGPLGHAKAHSEFGHTLVDNILTPAYDVLLTASYLNPKLKPQPQTFLLNPNPSLPGRMTWPARTSQH